MTVVLTTHYLNEVDDADKIYIVDHVKSLRKALLTRIKSYARNVLRILDSDSEGLKAAGRLGCE